MTGLSKRALAAVELMKAGAYWRCALEASKPGWGEKFRYRLRTRGAPIAGYGFAVWHELEKAGLLTRRECASSSTYPTEWALKAEAAEAAMGGT